MRSGLARENRASGAAQAPEVFKVLYDGWALARAPSSPAAMHLLALLPNLPEQVQAVVALPGPSPHILPAKVELLRQNVSASTAARLGWEQRGLPRAASRVGARLLHLVESHPPLSSPVPVMVSPADSAKRARSPSASAAERLRAALSLGAAATIRDLIWPSDLDLPEGWPRVSLLPPILPPAFLRGAEEHPPLPPGYILYHGPASEPALLELLEGWSWAEPAIGESFPLALAGLSQAEQRAAERLVAQAGFGSTVQLVDAVTSEDWAALYKSASEIVNLGPLAPWGSPVLAALAGGKPLVAVEGEQMSQRVGPAAYLVPPGDGRSLGAAMTTLVVETDLAETLSRAAAARAAAWHSEQFGEKLLALYRDII